MKKNTKFPHQKNTGSNDFKTSQCRQNKPPSDFLKALKLRVEHGVETFEIRTKFVKKAIKNKHLEIELPNREYIMNRLIEMAKSRDYLETTLPAVEDIFQRLYGTDPLAPEFDDKETQNLYPYLVSEIKECNQSNCLNKNQPQP